VDPTNSPLDVRANHSADGSLAAATATDGFPTVKPVLYALRNSKKTPEITLAFRVLRSEQLNLNVTVRCGARMIAICQLCDRNRLKPGRRCILSFLGEKVFLEECSLFQARQGLIKHKSPTAPLYAGLLRAAQKSS
jgi:hypothetical protein